MKSRRWLKYVLPTVVVMLGMRVYAGVERDSVMTEEEMMQWLEMYASPATENEAVMDSVDRDSVPSDTVSIDSVGVTKKDSVAVDIVSPDEIDRMISDAFAKSQGTDSIVDGKTEKNEQIAAKSSKPTKTVLKRRSHTARPRIPDIELTKQRLISAEDSLVTRYEALATADRNPLFMDWVAGAPRYRTKNLFDADSTIVELRNGAKKHVSMTNPELYDYHVSQLPKSAEINSRRMKTTAAERLALKSDHLKIQKDTTISVDLPDLPKWRAGAKFQLQASQNYISPNWYKGGESNLTGNLYAMGYCNYNDHKRIQWDNKLEWKLGVNSLASDTLRKIGINDDLLRLNSKLGVKAFKSFFYTAEFDFQTTLFETYKPESYIRSSATFSPIRMNISLGMDYKFKEKLSIFLSPISYKLVYVSDTTRHPSVPDKETIAYLSGITDGSRMINQLGALMRIGWEHKFNSSIEMEVKFSFFGNYVGYKKGIETDLEIIGNFNINRFLSAKISLNPRYDSTVEPPEGSKTKLQFRELISVGFNYVL